MGSELEYQAYLLRLWTVRHNGMLVWRAALDNVHTGERRTFADLASLGRYLEEKIVELEAQRREESERDRTRQEESR